MHRVGILGTGGMGSVHTNHYRRMDDVSVLAFDADSARLTEYCKRFQVDSVSSYDELLKRCDVIDICLPTQYHRETALTAIASGRAVLVEKPLAGTFEECIQIVEAASKASVPIMPAQVVRFFPEFARARDVVISGRIGEPAIARTRRGGAAPKRDWFLDMTKSGGVLLDVAVHDFDWLRWTLGTITQVTARSVAHSRRRSTSEVAGDYALSILKFESGAIAQVEATWLDPSGFRTSLEICGSKGMIEWDSRSTVALQGTTESGIVKESPLATSDDPYFLQLRGFLDYVSGKSDVPVAIEDGALAVAVAETAIESARTLRTLSPPSAC